VYSWVSDLDGVIGQGVPDAKGIASLSITNMHSFDDLQILQECIVPS